MNTLRALLVGAALWAMIFIEWSILMFTPGVAEMEWMQFTIFYLLLIPISLFGAWLFYKKESSMNGFLAGLLMLVAGIVLDAIITLPLFIIPQGGSYLEFYTAPLMLIGFVEMILVVGLYWMKKVK